MIPDIEALTKEDLDQFCALVVRWTDSINLVSKQSKQQIWNRHVLDSGQLFHVEHRQHGIWADLGSGGGFPGIVVAILAKHAGSSTYFTLVESDKRKATFLRTAIREFSLNAQVIVQRIEEATPLKADIVSARALARLDRLMELSHRHMNPGSVALFPKGETWKEEIQEAKRNWQFTYDAIPSKTSSSVILRIEGIARA